MFKWPNPLPVRPTEVEQADYDALVAWQTDLADFSEFTSWQAGSASDTHVSRQLAKAEENDHTNGVPVTDELHEEVQDAYGLVGERMESYGSAYPFELDGSGRSLQLRPHGDSPAQTLYKYLLLATRLNMNENRKHGGIDGADLFEQLCAEVASQYFGDGSRSLVFGTSSDLRSFPDRLDFTHFKRHKRGNLQYDGTEWRGVSVHRSWRSIVKNPPTPTTSGYAQR